MRYRFILVLVSLALPLRLLAQRCDGQLAFAVIDGGDTVRFAPNTATDTNPLLTGAGGHYTATASCVTQRTGHAAVATLTSYAGRPYSSLRYGCQSACDLVIVRRVAASAIPDTMMLHLENLADAHFGAVIPFHPGSFKVPVFDTTKHDVVYGRGGEAASFHYRSLREQYPGFVFGGFDVTGGIMEAVVASADVSARTVGISVSDHARAPIVNATVRVTRIDSAGGPIEVRRAWQDFTIAADPGAVIEISVSAPGYEPQTRRVDLENADSVIRFYLGAPGSAYTYYDGAPYPYRLSPMAIVAFCSQEHIDTVVSFGRSLGLSVSEIDRGGAVLFRCNHEVPRSGSIELARLRSNAMVKDAGIPIDWEQGHMTLVNRATVAIARPSSRHPRASAMNMRDSLLSVPGIVAAGVQRNGRKYSIALEPSLGAGVDDILRTLSERSDIVSVSGEITQFVSAR